jgi:hypothetical protein
VRGAWVFLMAVLPTVVLGHPGHDSVMEAVFRRETGMLEVTVSVHAVDLERALMAGAGRQVALDGADREVVDAMILGYLERSILIESEAAGRAAFAWVGRESKEESGHHVDGELVLLHFEVSLPGGLDGVSLRQAAFCEVHDDQINLVHLREGDKKVTLGFSPGREAQVVRLESRESGE